MVCLIKMEDLLIMKICLILKGNIKDFFLANTKKHLSDQKSAYNKQMIDESIQKIKDNLNVIIRLSIREIGNDLSIKTNFSSRKKIIIKKDIDEDEMNHEKRS